MADQSLQGKRVAIVAADMVERVELVEPRKALDDAGAQTELVSLKPGKIQSFDHFDPADEFDVDKTVEEVDASEYDALMIPGGVGNPDQLRGDENMVSFVRDFFQQGKPVAAICHAPWVLIEAGVVRDRKVTSWPTLQTDLRNAGANWVDEEVVVDSGLVTSRKPDDLPAFNKKMVEEFAEGTHSAQAQKTELSSNAEALS
ncbi:MAG: protease [Gaiellaceae bacterium]|jgi:protease I|nr:protease [Gaiellaceae bacterium]